jgi:hypothetical protein
MPSMVHPSYARSTHHSIRGRASNTIISQTARSPFQRSNPIRLAGDGSCQQSGQCTRRPSHEHHRRTTRGSPLPGHWRYSSPASIKIRTIHLHQRMRWSRNGVRSSVSHHCTCIGTSQCKPLQRRRRRARWQWRRRSGPWFSDNNVMVSFSDRRAIGIAS